MAQQKNTTDFTALLWACLNQEDPMLFLLDWLCEQLMEAEVAVKVQAAKSERAEERMGYRSGYRPRRFDTRMGTLYLLVPKVRSGGYIPFFLTEKKRSEAALIQVVQEAFVNGVSTRKMEKLAKSLGIEGISRSQVSEITKGLNEQVEAFRKRDLSARRYPILWIDALYEKVRIDGRVVSEAIIIVCGVDEDGRRDVLAIEPMPEESKDTYCYVFNELKARGLVIPRLIVSDANKGLVFAIKNSFLGASWQRCKVHFMRNILAHVPQRSKKAFAAELKEIWLSPNEETAKLRAEVLISKYQERFPKAIACLEDGLEDSLAFYQFPNVDSRKISSTNMLERLNKEVRRRTRVVGIFPTEDSYLRLVTTYLMEYSEDWSTSNAYIKQLVIKELIEMAA